MAEQKTQKEMFEYIKEQLAGDPEVVAFCEKKIEQLNKRKAAPRKANPEVQERRNAIYDYLVGQNEPVAVKDIADALGFSSPQVSGALRGLVTAGGVEVVEPEQKSKAKTYRAITDTEPIED